MRYFALIIIFVPTMVIGAYFSSRTFYSVCFTPGQNCEGKIITQIKRAKRTILVQAYSFTSKWIAKALVQAKKRGVSVKVILDKSQFNPKFYSVVGYLKQNGIPLWEDDQLNIAHNKIMIFDGQTVETGSFNYTVSAQKYNAENVLIIDNNKLAERYTKNWFKRQAASKKIT